MYELVFAIYFHLTIRVIQLWIYLLKSAHYIHFISINAYADQYQFKNSHSIFKVPWYSYNLQVLEKSMKSCEVLWSHMKFEEVFGVWSVAVSSLVFADYNVDMKPCISVVLSVNIYWHLRVYWCFKWILIVIILFKGLRSYLIG